MEPLIQGFSPFNRMPTADPVHNLHELKEDFKHISDWLFVGLLKDPIKNYNPVSLRLERLSNSTIPFERGSNAVVLV